MRAKTAAWKKILFSLIALVVLVGIVLAVLETYLRTATCLGSRPTMNPYIAHPVVGWVGRPGAGVVRSLATSCAEFRFNSMGFRGPERALEKPPGTLRILVLGDSFVEGYQFEDEDLLTTHLERMVAKKTGRPTEVINMGIGGWGTAQEVLAYQRMGRRMQPDIVVLVFATCNDVINATKALSALFEEKLTIIKPYFSLEGNELKLHLPPPQLVRRINTALPSGPQEAQTSPWQMMHGAWRYLCVTRTGFLLWSRWNRPSQLRLLLDQWGLVKFQDPMFRTTWGQHGYYRGLSLRFWIYSDRPDPLWHSALRVEKQLLVHLAAAAQLGGARFLLVSGSNIEQVEPEIWELTVQGEPQMRRFNLDLDLPEKRLLEIADQEQIPYLSLVPAFRLAAQHGQELFLRGDGHWNEEGQRLAAKAIYEYLVQYGYIK